MVNRVELVRHSLREFCLEFIDEPYLCYTEHGLHALFYTRLYNTFPENYRSTQLLGKRICVIQKEYPTAGNLGKSRRQHWDISVIKKPIESKKVGSSLLYDYLKLLAVIEFGMNAGAEHLLDDIERVCHPDANTEHKFIVHLYRLSKPGRKFSNRDWSTNFQYYLSQEKFAEMVGNRKVEVYFGIHDSTRKKC